MKLFKCNVCGQIITKVNDTKVDVFCCGVPMEQIKENESDINVKEKHVPTYKQDNNRITIRIGAIPHPMDDYHYIEWILLITNKGQYKRNLKPQDSPEVTFVISKDEKPLQIFAYCNIHSLWKLDVNKSI